jgi:hypothetical protein
MVKARTHRNPVIVELMVAEKQTKNIPPIVACARATEGCLQVVA